MILLPVFKDQVKTYRIMFGATMMVANLIAMVLFWKGVGTPFAFTILILTVANALTGIFKIPMEGYFWHLMTKPFPHVEDKRHVLTLDRSRTMWNVKWYQMTPEVEDWCRANCRGVIGIRPEIRYAEDRRIFWFTNRNDALHFKMRWG